MRKFIALTVLLMWMNTVDAQHCEFDGSIVLVLDIRNKTTIQPIAGLDVKIS